MFWLLIDRAAVNKLSANSCTVLRHPAAGGIPQDNQYNKQTLYYDKWAGDERKKMH